LTFKPYDWWTKKLEESVKEQEEEPPKEHAKGKAK